MNRFDQRAKDVPWVSTYVPLPLGLIADIGAKKQRKHDEDLADLDATKGLLKINSDPKQRAIRDRLLQNYDSQINALADEYMKSDDPSIPFKLQKLKRDFASDQDRMALENSYANYNLLQKDQEAYKKDSKYDEIYNPYAKFREKGADDRAENFDYTGMLTKVDTYDKAQDIMGNIAKDGSSWEGISINKQTGLPDIGSLGQYYSTKSGGEGIKKPKIVRLADEKADAFLRSDAGRYFLDSRVGQPIQYEKLSKEQKQAALNEASQYLVVAAAEQAGWTSRSGNNMEFLPESILKAQKEAAEQPRFTTETGATETSGTWAKTLGLDSYFNDDGSIKDNIGLNESFGVDKGSKSTTGALPLKLNPKDTKSSREQFIEKGLSELYNRSSKLGLNVTRADGTIDGEATKQALINYGKGLSVYSNYTVPLQDANLVNNLSKDIFGETSNLHNMSIYPQGNPESSSEFEGSDKKAQFKGSRVVGLDYTQPIAGAIKFIAPVGQDKDTYGDVPFIAGSRNKDLQDQMRPIQEITVKAIESAKSGKSDANATSLTNYLKGETVRDLFGNNIKLEQLGIPAGASRDSDGTLRVAYIDTSMGKPLIQVLVKTPGKPTEIKSLEEIQEERTGEIFNTGGSLSQYQKQGTNTQLPTQNFQQ